MDNNFLKRLPSELLIIISSFLIYEDIIKLNNLNLIELNLEEIFQNRYTEFYIFIKQFSNDQDLKIKDYIKKDNFWNDMLSDMDWIEYDQIRNINCDSKNIPNMKDLIEVLNVNTLDVIHTYIYSKITCSFLINGTIFEYNLLKSFILMSKMLEISCDSMYLEIYKCYINDKNKVFESAEDFNDIIALDLNYAEGVKYFLNDKIIFKNHLVNTIRTFILHSGMLYANYSVNNIDEYLVMSIRLFRWHTILFNMGHALINNIFIDTLDGINDVNNDIFLKINNYLKDELIEK